MVEKITLERDGDSVRTSLPVRMVEHLTETGQAGWWFALETDRGILLTPQDPKLDKALRIYRRGALKYQAALQELA